MNNNNTFKPLVKSRKTVLISQIHLQINRWPECQPGKTSVKRINMNLLGEQFISQFSITNGATRFVSNWRVLVTKTYSDKNIFSLIIIISILKNNYCDY
jgi:hypothetical protein